MAKTRVSKGTKRPKSKSQLRPKTLTKNKYVKAGKNGPEIKFSDLSIGPGVMGVAGTVIDAGTYLAQGVTQITRIGNKVQAKSIQLKADCLAGGVAGDLIHWALVLDKEPELGAIAIYADIFTIPAINFAQGFINVNNSERFKILSSGHTSLMTAG